MSGPPTKKRLAILVKTRMARISRMVKRPGAMLPRLNQLLDMLAPVKGIPQCRRNSVVSRTAKRSASRKVLCVAMLRTHSH